MFRLFLFCAIILTAAIGLSLAPRAQTFRPVPAFSSAQDGLVTAPDWTQFSPLPPASSQPRASFYDRCVEGNDPLLSGPEQVALCSCMAAKQAGIDASKSGQTWLGAIRAGNVSDYETFVTQVFAPCMYIEAQPIASDACYRNTRFAIDFKTSQRYDDYCSCYAEAAENYVKLYAQPLLSAKMEQARGGYIQLPADPADIVTRDADYQIFMEARRKDCMQRYGIDNTKAR